MATGIQTSVRRGRSGISGRQQIQNLTSLQKTVQFLSQFQTKTKVIFAGVVLGLLFTIGAGYSSVQSNQFVDLYPLKMNAEDVRDVSQALTSAQIEHELAPTNDSVLLHPSDRLLARARLAALSLPRHRPTFQADENSAFRTSGQQRAAELRRIESELAYSIRQMEGINDARVQLAIPEKTYFIDDQKAATASVFLKLAHENLDPKSVRGIASLVSHSVPELSMDDITVLNDAGWEIVERPTPESLEEELVASKERRLQEKLLRVLRMKYQDGVHAEVNVALDFSKEEHRRYTPGGETDEGLVKDSLQVIHETLEGAIENSKGKNYNNKKESVNFKYQENYHARLRESAQIERLTASVIVDGADDKEIAGIIQTVSGTIGIDDTRGDAVFVDNDPWNRNLGAMWQQPLEAPPAANQPAILATAGQYAGLAITFVASCLICGMFLVRRFQPVMNVEMGGQSLSNPHGIVDQNHTKDGSRMQGQGETQYNGSRMQALESLVGNEPTKVAELLKSTWLSR